MDHYFFADMTRQRLCCGVVEAGRPVSCTDAPSVPYMAAQVQEVGINTLLESVLNWHAPNSEGFFRQVKPI